MSATSAAKCDSGRVSWLASALRGRAPPAFAARLTALRPGVPSPPTAGVRAGRRARADESAAEADIDAGECSLSGGGGGGAPASELPTAGAGGCTSLAAVISKYEKGIAGRHDRDAPSEDLSDTDSSSVASGAAAAVRMFFLLGGGRRRRPRRLPPPPLLLLLQATAKR